MEISRKVLSESGVFFLHYNRGEEGVLVKDADSGAWTC